MQWASKIVDVTAIPKGLAAAGIVATRWTQNLVEHVPQGAWSACRRGESIHSLAVGTVRLVLWGKEMDARGDNVWCYLKGEEVLEK